MKKKKWKIFVGSWKLEDGSLEMEVWRWKFEVRRFGMGHTETSNPENEDLK